jgi:hypothetical protein
VTGIKPINRIDEDVGDATEGLLAKHSIGKCKMLAKKK